MSDLAWISGRIPGDPRFVRLIESGEVAMPALTTARARWEARQADVIGNGLMRARMLLPILDQFDDETSARFSGLTMAELRSAVAALAGGER
jgi:hypothetical protein